MPGHLTAQIPRPSSHHPCSPQAASFSARRRWFPLLIGLSVALPTERGLTEGARSTISASGGASPRLQITQASGGENR